MTWGRYYNRSSQYRRCRVTRATNLKIMSVFGQEERVVRRGNMKPTQGKRYVRYSLMVLLIQLLCWPAGGLHAQNFAPPASAQKYSFYPQGGNFFGDLWPNNFVDLDTSAGIRAYKGSDYSYNGHLGIDTEIKGFAAQAVGVPVFAALDGTVIEAHDGEFDMNTQSGNQPVN